MTKFVKEQFESFGGYTTYGADHRFVARFKYQRGASGSFITFLIKNFEVEEYFGRLEAGEAPLPILESKGYLMPHIKKWLKAGGYSLDKEGHKAFIRDQIAARRAA